MKIISRACKIHWIDQILYNGLINGDHMGRFHCYVSLLNIFGLKASYNRFINNLT